LLVPGKTAGILKTEDWLDRSLPKLNDMRLGAAGSPVRRWRFVVAKHLYLRKANDDFVSHCKCPKADSLISSPGQMDCPWCGCGWLFICSRCNKAMGRD
jgi:hypothetical protein